MFLARLTDAKPQDVSTMVLGHACVVPGPFLPVLTDGAVVVQDGQVVAVGPTESIKSQYANELFIDASDHILMPGLFNAHTHVAMGFFRGLGHGKEEMIERFLFPAERRLTPELLEPLSYSYILDGLRAGVTSFVDHYYFSAGIGRAFETFGVRGWLGETVADLGGAFPGRESWDRSRALIKSGNFSSRISHVIAPHATDTVSPELLREIATFASQNDLPLHMHLSQTTGERQRVKSRDGMSPTEAASRAGALGPKSLVVHLTSASETDLSLIEKSGATIGYCPTSTIIYEHLAPIDGFYRHRIPLAIGTDCAASNDSADVLGELKIAGILGRHHQIPSELNSPDHLLAMATTIPARVLGRERDLGTLEPGKKADLVAMKRGLSALPSAQRAT